MPDLAQALAEMFSGGDMTVFQATVDAVGDGVVTVHANGGNFTEVPWITSAFFPAYAPTIGDTVYVLGRKDWGMIVIGKPAPGPERSTEDGAVIEWEPASLYRWTSPSSWLVANGSGEVAISSGDTGQVAVFFFDLDDLPTMTGTGLATASFFLDMPSFDTGGMGIDYNYLEIGLHSKATPSGTLTLMPNLDATYQAYAGISQYVSIPLDWAGRLLSGEAQGIYVKSFDYPCVIGGPGTVRLTEL